ncbi:hypothetical protein [uncultured Bartonella sp.]|uniref:hypothetical protein n=1 Tax=uncultured Bartonella sp. TaxID=104108 RepID=UPI002613FE49|nr:hypothetical protein [uncultured Bartonella sp.]
MAGLLLCLFLPLTIHVLMLEYLDIPYPDSEVKSWFLYYSVNAIIYFMAVSYLYKCAAHVFSAIKPSIKFAFLWCILIGTDETLRGWGMNIYCVDTPLKSSPFIIIANSGMLIFSLISLLWVDYIYSLKLVSKKRTLILAGSSLIAGVIIYPLVQFCVGNLLSLLDSIEPTGAWCVQPYGWKVNLPAYISFIEPVVSLLCAVYIIYPCLPDQFCKKLFYTIVFVLALKMQLLSVPLYGLYNIDNFFANALSMSQFTIEFLCLGILCLLTIYFYEKNS